jgi:hypothetical protein
MPRHLVHFYDDAYPAEEASDFLVAGLLAGDTCIVMLSPLPRQAVEARLSAHRMFSPPASPHSGHLLMLDTVETLSRLMVDGRLDMARATESMGALLSPASHGGRGRVRLVGDPAAVLFAAGNAEDSLALEAMVGELATAHGASIFCAYSMQAIHRHGNTHALLKLCAEHHAVQLPKTPWIQGFVQTAQRASDRQG